MNQEIKIDETVISSVTDIGHVVKHVRMLRKVREHILAARKKDREYSQARYYNKYYEETK